MSQNFNPMSTQPMRMPPMPMPMPMPQYGYSPMPPIGYRTPLSMPQMQSMPRYPAPTLYTDHANVPMSRPPPSFGYGMPPHMQRSRPPMRYRGRPPMRPSSGYYPPPPMQSYNIIAPPVY